MTEPDFEGRVRPRQDRSHRTLRWLLAAPGALLISILMMASFPMVLPKGAGGVNHLLFPVLAFPLIWATLIILPVSTRRVLRMAWVYAGLLALCLAIIGLSFLV